jgi:hypothetical protein
MQSVTSLYHTSNFISYDGNNLLISRPVDGALFVDFDNDVYRGVAFIADPYKDSIDDNKENSSGYKNIAIKNNTIILAKGHDDLYIGELDLTKIDKPVNDDNKLIKGLSIVDWSQINNPHKQKDERYIQIGFVNSNHIYALSIINSESESKSDGENESDNKNNIKRKYYHYNILTNEWYDLDCVNETEELNIDNECLYILDPEKKENNLRISTFDESQNIQSKIYNLNSKYSSVSPCKKICYFYDSTLFVIAVKDFIETNNDDELRKLHTIQHKIKFIDDKEIFTDCNITCNSYIVLTNKNIYVKLFSDSSNEWRTLSFTSTDLYLIHKNDPTTDSINNNDISSVFWNRLYVSKNNVIVISSLDGHTYFMKINESGYNFNISKLPPIYCKKHNIFSKLCDMYMFFDIFNNIYKIIFNSSEEEQFVD